MKHDPSTPEDENSDMPPDDLPVINIDDDPDNANWIRILEQRRKEHSDGSAQQPPHPPQEQ